MNVLSGEPNQFGVTSIANGELTIDDIPPPNADFWPVVSQFALTYDVYSLHPNERGNAAQRALEKFRRLKQLPGSLRALRTCLFFEQRGWRHSDGTPEGEDLAYIHALVEAIRAKVVVNTRS